MKGFLLNKQLLRILAKLLIYSFRILPIKKSKVIALVGVGEKFDDNPRFIIESLHQMLPNTDVVWVKNENASYSTPDWIRTVEWATIRCIYEFATANVWIANCVIDYFPKRKDQLYIETWHGGLGIKKVGLDLDEDKYQKVRGKKWEKCPADVFISNSNHLSKIYRRAFLYEGLIWKCGYPKNDVLIYAKKDVYERVREKLGVNEGVKFVLYAPTWRKRFKVGKYIDDTVYNIDFKRLIETANRKYGGEWIVVKRYHPIIRSYIEKESESKVVVDGSYYPDMQELILASDIVISDYSSCIFDAALRKIPCFTYATDFEHYKNEERGVSYEMSELPFPYAKNNDELMENIINFDERDYFQKWDAFAERMGLVETGHASRDIAEKIVAHINGEMINWKEIVRG